MIISKLSAAFVVAATIAAAAVPASAAAASQITEAFLANVRPNIAFLESSSKLAAAHAANPAARAYARNEATVATMVAARTDGIETGRSAAIAGMGQAANGRQPVGLDDLTTLSGKPFDDLYWEKQLDALSQLAADYNSYAQNGDDPALVAMAKRELPKIERRLKALSAI